MQIFRESLCMQELKVLQFQAPNAAFPGILRMQELDVLHFPGLCGRKGSKCCTFCARKGAACFNVQGFYRVKPL